MITWEFNYFYRWLNILYLLSEIRNIEFVSSFRHDVLFFV